MRRFLFLSAALAWGCSLLVDSGGLDDGAVGPLGPGDSGLESGAEADTDADVGADVDADARSSIGDAYRAAVLADGPALYLRLDEDAGTEAADEVGAPSLYVGAFSLGEPGAFSGSTAVRFTGGIGGIRVGDRFVFPGNAPYTLEGWFRPDAYDADFRFLIGRDARPDSGRQGYNVWVNDVFGLAFERNVDGTKTTVTLQQKPELGVYHHVVSTYDGTELRLYVDGVAKGVAADTRSAPPSPSVVWFGCIATGEPSLTGALDEVAIYETALPVARVVAHYRAAGR